MLAAGVLDAVESRNRAADASHPVIEKGADRRRGSPHDLVDQGIDLDLHLASPFCLILGLGVALLFVPAQTLKGFAGGTIAVEFAVAQRRNRPDRHSEPDMI